MDVKQMKVIFYILIISISYRCTNSNTISDEAGNYIKDAIDLLEEKSVNKNHIDWVEFRRIVFEKAKGAKSIEDTYSSISFAISLLDDNHSYFKPVTEIADSENGKELPLLPDESTPNDIGYIRLPFCIGTELQLDEYISSIQNKIFHQSNRQLKGWIIDLRGNFGGNMWPMLLAIEPLIGNGIMGYFVDVEGGYKPWKLINGQALLEENLVYVNKDFKNLLLTTQYIAVLTDHETASSGEAIAIALKSKDNTRSFGTPTYGVSTGCVSHRLSDGSTINLSESIFADRKKTLYGQKVIPDIETNVDEALANGIQWIYQSNSK